MEAIHVGEPKLRAGIRDPELFRGSQFIKTGAGPFLEGAEAESWGEH